MHPCPLCARLDLQLLAASAGASGFRRTVVENLHRRTVTFRKGRDLLFNPVFENAEIGRLEAVDVLALAVGDSETQHHQGRPWRRNTGVRKSCPTATAHRPPRRGSRQSRKTQPFESHPAPSDRSASRNAALQMRLYPLSPPAHSASALRLPPSAGSQQRRPVLEMRRKNPFHDFLRPLRHQHIQLRRLQYPSHPPDRPSTEVRFPALGHDAAGITHQGWEGAQIEQFLAIGIGERRFGRSPRPRDRRRCHLLRHKRAQMLNLRGFRTRHTPCSISSCQRAARDNR